MHRSLLAILALVVNLATTLQSQGNNVNTLLENAPTTHPRLFLKPAELDSLKAKIQADPVLRATSEHVLELANRMVDLPTLERIQEGRRLLEVSRQYLRCINYLAMAYQLTGDSRYAKAAEEQMLAAACFSDWNPSHFLDVAEMTAALAIGYDWCYDALTPESRIIIRDAIIEKGLKASLADELWWVTRSNNWNQVCHAGMVMGALVVHEDAPELAQQIIERSRDTIHFGMSVYAPDGAYPEGPMYWSYGTSFNVLLIDALESVLSTDFGMAKTTGFLESSDYYQQVTGPSGNFFNYCDSRLRKSVSPEMFWFANKRQKPSLLAGEEGKLAEFLKASHQAEGNKNRLFPLILLWSPPISEITPPKEIHWIGGGESPVGLHRSSWNDNAQYLGIKGGGPNVGHGHMDAGAFVFESDGVRWAEDLGMQNYHSLESKGISLWNEQRWTIFRLNNYSHNTLVVDGQLQESNGNPHAPIIAHQQEGDMPYTQVDLGEIYAGQLATVKRGGGLHTDGFAIIQDELTALDQETEVRWGMITHAEVTFDNDQQATLKQDGQQLTLRVLSPTTAKLKVHSVENPPMEYDKPNPGAKMISYTVKIPANAKETISIALIPGSSGEATPEITPLENW